MPQSKCGRYCRKHPDDGIPSHYEGNKEDGEEKTVVGQTQTGIKKRKRSDSNSSPKPKRFKRQKGFSTPKKRGKSRHDLVLRTQLDDMANDVVIKVLTERGWHCEYPYNPLENSTSPVFHRNLNRLRSAARGKSTAPWSPGKLPKKCMWWVDWAVEGKALMESLPEGIDHIVARFPGTDTSQLKHHITNKIGDAKFYPKSFEIPRQKKALLAATKTHGKFWIAKPSEGDNGQGIMVFHSDSPEWRKFLRTQKRPIVVQRYIANPATFPCAVGGGQGKFHMRTYALCTSVNPLDVYTYRYTYAECASRAFTLSKKTLGNDFDGLVHITNTMVQRVEVNKEWLQEHKPGIHFGQKGRGGNIMGDRQLHKCLTKYWGKQYGGRDKFNEQIRIGTGRSVQALMTHGTVQKHRAMLSKHSFFELFGLDWLMDTNGKLWLLEINATPGIYLTPDGGKLHWGGMDPDRVTVDADVIRLTHDLAAFLGMDNHPKGNASNWVNCPTTFD